MKVEKRHNLTSLKCFIGLFLFIFNIAQSIAEGLKLRSFDANFSLHIAKLHVADSKLSLSQIGDLWRWQTSTKPRGVYSLLSNKKPYSETKFSLDDGRHLIQNILISDENDKNLYEKTDFNWQIKQAETLREKLIHKTTLDGDVYDYHSINWLIANMIKTEKMELEVDFYLKGMIVKSVVKKIHNQNIEAAGQTLSAWVYEQTTVNSSSKFRYYFNPKIPLIPLKIEKLKPGKKTATLLLESVNWH